MKQERVTLTMKELQRVKAMDRLCAGVLSNQEAADELGICRRQIIRLKRKYKEQGERGLIHGNRGRQSHHRLGDEIRARVLCLYQQKYYDFNFSHFTERLNEEEGISVSRSSVARILKTEGIRSKRSIKRRPKLHRSRPRRESAGMLWQTDASLFEWLGRGNGYWALHAFIDDATGTVVGAYFTKNECLRGYINALKQGIESYGLPMEIYSDRHAIFRPAKELTEEEKLEGKTIPLTRFGEGLKELGIGQIFALTPQAKGRIERLWGTLQDRLPCRLRSLEITNIEDANRVLPELLKQHNEKFAVKAREEDRYAPLDRKIDMNILFGTRVTRKTDRGGVISYKGSLYVPVGSAKCPALAQSSVEVRESLDGRILVKYKGTFIRMEKVEKPERVHEPPRQEKKESRPMKAHKPAPDHPWRHSPIGKAKHEYNTTSPFTRRGDIFTAQLE